MSIFRAKGLKFVLITQNATVLRVFIWFMTESCGGILCTW